MNKIDCLMPITEYPEGLDYLRWAYSSFRRTRSAKSQLKIHLDGPNPAVKDFLDTCKVEYTESPWKGLTKTLDEMIKESDAEFVIPIHDDCVFSPDWDVNLLKWFDTVSGEAIINPHLLSHGPPRERGYKKEATFFGHSHHNFDYDAFIDYIVTYSTRQLLPWKSGIQLMRKSTYEYVGGYDLQFSPFGYFDLDFHMRCFDKGVRLLEAQDSYLWHFGASAKAHIKQTSRNMDNDEQLKLFIAKYHDRPIHVNRQLLSKLLK